MSRRPQWLTTYDENGHPHVVRYDELQAGMHWQQKVNQVCPCNPRFVGGTYIHRQMTRGNLYAPWEKRGN